MIKTLHDLKRLLAFAKKIGVTELKVRGIEVKLNQDGTATVPIIAPKFRFTKTDKADLVVSEPNRMPSDDEMLFMSTDHFDQLRAERKEALKPESERN